jgi:hypothetical protein
LEVLWVMVALLGFALAFGEPVENTVVQINE